MREVSFRRRTRIAAAIERPKAIAKWARREWRWAVRDVRDLAAEISWQIERRVTRG